MAQSNGDELNTYEGRMDALIAILGKESAIDVWSQMKDNQKIALERLIADRKQHELEARLDEIKLTKDNSDESYLGEDWFSDENIKDNSAHEVPLSYFVKREAELKAEREALC